MSTSLKWRRIRRSSSASRQTAAPRASGTTTSILDRSKATVSWAMSSVFELFHQLLTQLIQNELRNYYLVAANAMLQDFMGATTTNQRGNENVGINHNSHETLSKISSSV